MITPTFEKNLDMDVHTIIFAFKCDHPHIQEKSGYGCGNDSFHDQFLDPHIEGKCGYGCGYEQPKSKNVLRRLTSMLQGHRLCKDSCVASLDISHKITHAQARSCSHIQMLVYCNCIAIVVNTLCRKQHASHVAVLMKLDKKTYNNLFH